MFVWVVAGSHLPYEPRPTVRRRRVDPIGRASAVPDATASERPRNLPTQAYEAAADPPAEPRIAVAAREIMSTPVVSVAPEARASEVAALLAEHGFHHLPVLAPNGRLVGMISDRDVLRTDSPEQSADRTMSRRVLTAAPDTPIRELARVMVTERIGAVPIVGPQGLVGIVTQNDVLRCLVNRAPLDLWIR